MNVFTEISTRELENTLKGKAVRYIVNDAGEGLCLFFEGQITGEIVASAVGDKGEISRSQFHRCGSGQSQPTGS